MQIPSRILALELPPFDPLNTRAAQLRAAGHQVISLGQALPFYPPPASVLRAAQAALERPDVHAYSTDPGRPSLRRALAARLLEEAHIECGPDDLLITAGANHAFTTALTTLSAPATRSCCRRPTSRIIRWRSRRPVRPHRSAGRRPRFVQRDVGGYRAGPDQPDARRGAVQPEQSNRRTGECCGRHAHRVELASRDILVISDERTCISSTGARTGAPRRSPVGGGTSSWSARFQSRLR